MSVIQCICTYIQTDRQTDRQAGRQNDRLTDRLLNLLFTKACYTVSERPTPLLVCVVTNMTSNFLLHLVSYSVRTYVCKYVRISDLQCCIIENCRGMEVLRSKGGGVHGSECQSNLAGIIHR